MKDPHKPICYLKNTCKYIPYLTRNTAFQLHHKLFKENNCRFMAVRPKRKIHALNKFRSLKFRQFVAVHWISTRSITFTLKIAVIFSSANICHCFHIHALLCQKYLCISPLTILCYTFKVFTIALNVVEFSIALEDKFKRWKTCLTECCMLYVPSEKQLSLPLG